MHGLDLKLFKTASAVASKVLFYDLPYAIKFKLLFTMKWNLMMRAMIQTILSYVYLYTILIIRLCLIFLIGENKIYRYFTFEPLGYNEKRNSMMVKTTFRNTHIYFIF